nr:MAG TPA: hypothetical protein [Caudoviricetes sp.]
MTEKIIRILNDERKKNEYFNKAETMLKDAEIKNISVDRQQFSAKLSDDIIICSVAIKKFTKNTVKLSDVRKLRKLPGYRPIYDRLMKVKPRPLFEWGYIDFEEK